MGRVVDGLMIVTACYRASVSEEKNAQGCVMGAWWTAGEMDYRFRATERGDSKYSDWYNGHARGA